MEVKIPTMFGSNWLGGSKYTQLQESTKPKWVVLGSGTVHYHTYIGTSLDSIIKLIFCEVIMWMTMIEYIIGVINIVVFTVQIGRV